MLVKYLLPVFTVGLALGLAVVLLRTVGWTPAIGFAFLFAILVSAWRGGYVPGILACCFSIFLAPYVVVPGFTLARADLNRLLLVILVSLLVSSIAAQRRRVETALRLSNAELDKRVSERTRELDEALSALKEREERQRRAVEAGKVGLWDWDIVKNEVTWSEQIYELHGLQPGAFDGTVESFSRLIHPQDRDRVGALLTETLAGDRPYEVEFRPLRPDGQHRWLSTSGSVTFDTEGKAVFMRGAVVDTTARRDAEEALRRTNDELEEFASIASHDLQEPLRQIALCSQILQHKYANQLDADAQQYLSLCETGARRMRTLIEDLLTYSRSTRATEPSPESVDLNQVLASINETLAPRIHETSAEIVVPALPCVVGHSSLLTQLWQNLLVNALTYRSEEPPYIQIRVSREPGEWAFAVSDNGIGIPPEYHEKIFHIFHRLHTREKYSGTGLGLAICKKIVERNGGRIWVESASGKGATFHFTHIDSQS
jgi:PAS domain S-box-containing protein